jgi:hypothetical protein
MNARKVNKNNTKKYWFILFIYDIAASFVLVLLQYES